MDYFLKFVIMKGDSRFKGLKHEMYVVLHLSAGSLSGRLPAVIHAEE